MKTVCFIQKSSLPKNSNGISSRTIHKLKFNDDNSLKLKLRVAPHGTGNESSIKTELKSGCTMCSSSGCELLFLTAAYGLVNSNANWKSQSD